MHPNGLGYKVVRGKNAVNFSAVKQT